MKYSVMATPTATGLHPTQMTPRHIRCTTTYGMHRNQSVFCGASGSELPPAEVSNHRAIATMNLRDFPAVPDLILSPHPCAEMPAARRLMIMPRLPRLCEQAR